MHGVCVTQNTRVTASAALKFAGTTNGLEYAIVGFEKAHFPVAEAVDISLRTGDRCDVESWKALWLNPVPGTVVWSGREPYLLTSPSKAGSLWVTMTNVTGQNTVRARKTGLADEAPKNRAFRTQLKVPGCLGLKGASSKLSISLAKCSDRQRRKYDKLWDQAHRAKDNARSIGGWRAADRRLGKLGDKQRAEWNRTCGPTRRKIEKRFEAAYNAIVDHFVDGPPAPVVHRAARLRAEEASR